MRRVSVLSLLLVALLVGLVAAGAVAQEGTPSVGGAQPQDATPGAMVGHPVVGAWVVLDPTAPGDTPSVTVFTSDGILLDASADGPAAGSWVATGPRTAANTFVVPLAEEGFGGTVIIRGTVEVDETGDTFTSPYSYTVVAADGTVVDAGQGTVHATRIPVEPVAAGGTPLAAVPTWTVATPEAGTPAP